MDQIDKAKKFLTEKYKEEGLKTKHPLRVHDIIKEKFQVKDDETLVAALLHDIVEDTNTPPSEVEELFGIKVRDLVLELTHKQYSEGKPTPQDYEAYHTRLLSISENAKIIKLADEATKYESLVKLLKWFHKKRLKKKTLLSTEQSIRAFLNSSKDIEATNKVQSLVDELDETFRLISNELKEQGLLKE